MLRLYDRHSHANAAFVMLNFSSSRGDGPEKKRRKMSLLLAEDPFILLYVLE